MGSKWNSLYGWHWFTHLDKEQGVRVVHENLSGFVPWIDYLRQRRDCSHRPAWRRPRSPCSPGRSDLINFWRQNDPRMTYTSHPRRNAYFGGGEAIDYCNGPLSEWGVNYDLIGEEHLLHDLGRYKLLIISEPNLSVELAGAIDAWLKRGGKLVLLPNAARLDDWNNPHDWFGKQIAQQNVTVRFYRDFVGWEKEATFPMQASVVLLERIDSLQLPEILEWSGTSPVLTYIDPPLPAQQYDMGSCREAEVTNFFYWRNHVSAYSLVGEDGRRMHVLVQRGRDTDPVENLVFKWRGNKPVTMHVPPKLETSTLRPADGKLVLPTWKDVCLLIVD